MIDCGDKNVINSLYRKMGRAIMAKAFSIVNRQDVAAEIVQDTFTKLWEKAPQMPEEKAIYVWLYKTCQRQAIDHVRSASVRREHYAADDFSSQADKTISFGERLIN